MENMLYMDAMIDNVVMKEMENIDQADNEQEVKLLDELSELVCFIKSKYIAKGFRLGYEECSKKIGGGTGLANIG